MAPQFQRWLHHPWRHMWIMATKFASVLVTLLSGEPHKANLCTEQITYKSGRMPHPRMNPHHAATAPLNQLTHAKKFQELQKCCAQTSTLRKLPQRKCKLPVVEAFCCQGNPAIAIHGAGGTRRNVPKALERGKHDRFLQMSILPPTSKAKHAFLFACKPTVLFILIHLGFHLIRIRHHGCATLCATLEA